MIDSTTATEEDHTHYCEDCDVELAIMYDERESEEIPVVCGHCGGTNTRQLENPA